MDKTYCFDIDGIIMTLTPNNNYSKAEPIQKTIEIINLLYQQGNHIIIFTSRGYITGIDWSEITKKQLNIFHVMYHELIFGKPAADYYIDDKLISIQEIANQLNL